MTSVAERYDNTMMLTGRALAEMGMISDGTQNFRTALEINPKDRLSRFYLEKYSTDGKGKD